MPDGAMDIQPSAPHISTSDCFLTWTSGFGVEPSNLCGKDHDCVGPISQSRLRDQRVTGSRPDFTEDPPWAIL
ncbi:hypothetical protein AVEN_54817-1 [Araneus ventricosus]|uniref:Uncharacterized protein n=1 Tax=Araneus ventricosus TaxID=182803 RepID=A0A4Y2F073_ARAVE|nr:hypothetical protein AVEN_54817-1 [Araneus ventricosus]